MRNSNESQDAQNEMMISRRNLFKVAGVGGAMVLTAQIPLLQSKAIAQTNPASSTTLGALIRIGADDVVTLVLPRAEMGQGVHTALAMLIAEELEIDLATVRMEHAPANDKLYGRPDIGVQLTGGSNSIRTHWMPTRQMATAARMMLVSAAAQTWGVEPRDCKAEKGSVIHPASGRRLRYGQLAGRAAQLAVPTEIPQTRH